MNANKRPRLTLEGPSESDHSACNTNATSLPEEAPPEICDPMQFIGITHAGPYCKNCKGHFLPPQWRNHFNKTHPEILLPKRASNIVQLLNFQWSNVKKNDSPAKYAQSPKKYRRIQCNECEMLFRDSSQIDLHFASKHNKCSSSDGFRRTECHLLICGRHYPMGEATKATNGGGAADAAGVDNTIERRTPNRPGEINLNPSIWTQPIPSNNPALKEGPILIQTVLT